MLIGREIILDFVPEYLIKDPRSSLNEEKSHKSLRFDKLETPSKAFIRKLKR